MVFMVDENYHPYFEKEVNEEQIWLLNINPY